MPDLLRMMGEFDRQLRSHAQAERIRWISTNAGNTIKIFPIEEVLFFESDSRYTRVVSATDEGLVRTTIKQLQQGLDPAQFWQIHRSTIVNLAHLAGARVLQGDGSKLPFAPADVIYVNAGASRPADTWLDGLKDGGRLILPLTTSQNFRRFNFAHPTGAVFRITRRGESFDADFVSAIGVFPCEGMRDEVSERALAAGFEKGGYREVKRLLRTDDVSDEDCWVKAPGWSLAYR